MRFTLVLSTFFTITFASIRPMLEVVQVREIVNRQASSFDLGTLIPTACLLPSSLMSIEGSAPTLPADVESIFATWSDYCHAPSLTGKAASEYSSYTSALSSWAKENEPKLESWESQYATACPYAASLSVPTILPSRTLSLALSLASCGDSTSITRGGSSATGTAGTGGGGTALKGTVSVSTGAAPQPTDFGTAAGIFAGFVGLVAVI